MPEASAGTRRKSSSKAGKARDRALVARLTGAGEDALQRIADLPGGHRALGAFSDLRTRVDELGKKVRGIDELERRIARLEKQVSELKSPRKTGTRTTTRRTPTRST